MVSQSFIYLTSLSQWRIKVSSLVEEGLLYCHYVWVEAGIK